jgi:hypothetical protein
MEQYLDQLRAFVEKNKFTLVIAGVALVTVIAAARVAIPARRHKAELAAESDRLQAVIARSNLWVSQFQPASNEESAIWQNSANEIQALGVKPSEKLTLAQIVSRRADDAGFDGAHLKFVPVEGSNAVPPRQVAGVTFNPAPYKLVIMGEGGFSALAKFLEAVPPAVELQAVSLTVGGDARVSTSLTLSVFEPAGAK